MAPAGIVPAIAGPGTGAVALREMFREKAEELARLQAELAERTAVMRAMQGERDALRARLRGEFRGGEGAGFVSIQVCGDAKQHSRCDTHDSIGNEILTTPRDGLLSMRQCTWRLADHPCHAATSQELREVEAEAQSLKAQLVEALEESQVREREFAAAEEELERTHGALQGMLDQRALLYREYARLREQRDAEAARMQEQLRKAGDAQAELKAENQQLQRTLAALRPVNPDAPTGADVARLAEELHARTRALVKAEVAVVRLGRQLGLAETAEVSLKRRMRECEVRGATCAGVHVLVAGLRGAPNALGERL